MYGLLQSANFVICELIIIDKKIKSIDMFIKKINKSTDIYNLEINLIEEEEV